LYEGSFFEEQALFTPLQATKQAVADRFRIFSSFLNFENYINNAMQECDLKEVY
jgi:hypothetical protein